MDERENSHGTRRRGRGLLFLRAEDGDAPPESDEVDMADAADPAGR